MMRHAHTISTIVGLAALLCSSAPAYADLLTPGDVLKISFDMRDYSPPPSLASLDVLQVSTIVDPIEPVDSYTVRVLDRGRLLGSQTTTLNGILATSFFTSPTSAFTSHDPSVIDFSSFEDGSFDGVVELRIGSGLANWGRHSEGVVLGHAIGASVFENNAFAYPDQNASWQIVPAESPVPEPAPLLPFGVCAATLALRRRWEAARQTD